MNQKLSTKNLMLCAMFTALIAVGAFIKIPIPVMPFTLQLFFTTMAGLLLGSKLGALSVVVYLLLGLIGLPIFTEGGGVWYVLKPTFGYIIGFCVATFVTGFIMEKTKYTIKNMLIANFIGLMIVYAFGMIYFYMISNFVINQPIAVWPLFIYCFFLAVPGDIFLCVMAAILAKRVKDILPYDII